MGIDGTAQSRKLEQTPSEILPNHHLHVLNSARRCLAGQAPCRQFVHLNENLRSDRTSESSSSFLLKEERWKKVTNIFFCESKIIFCSEVPLPLCKSNWIDVLKAETAFETKYVVQFKIKWEERRVAVERRWLFGELIQFFSPIVFNSLSKLEDQLLTQLSPRLV